MDDPTPAEAFVSAAAAGDERAVEALLDSGVEIARPYSGNTALMAAAQKGHVGVMRLLLARGARVEAREAGQTALHRAAEAGEDSAVRLLIKAGADVAERNWKGWTALMEACAAGHVKAVRRLLDAGSPLDTIDPRKGDTPLMLARRRRSDLLEGLLLERGAAERPIRRPAPGEPPPFITDCDVCAFVPHMGDLDGDESPESITGLEHLLADNGSGSRRYGHVSDLLERCSVCGTCYHHDHSVDSEDAFVAGPTIYEHIQRLLPERCKELFPALGRDDLLRDLQTRQERLLVHFRQLAARPAIPLRDNIRPYLVEVLSDDFTLAGDWDGLERVLLRSPDPRIAVKALGDLFLIHAHAPDPGPWPSFSESRDITAAVRQRVRGLLRGREEAIGSCLEPLVGHADPAVRRKAEWLVARSWTF